MQWLAELCVRRPVFASVLILSLTVIGIFAFGQLGVDRLPQVDFPTVAVTTRLPGAAPEQVESEVTDKIEEAVNTISGIDQLSSNSAEGISQVIVTFRLEKNADVAAQEVRDRINRILPLLPRTITQPTIEKQDPDAAPILTIAVTAKKPIRDVTEYTDKVLRRRLESTDGVGQVLVLGGRKRQINVWVDADRLHAYNLTVNDVSRALLAQNADIPGGRIDQGPQSITMRTRGRVDSPEQFGALVAAAGGGPPGANRRRRTRGRWRGGRHDTRQHQRRPDRAPPDSQAVRHQHGRSRQQRQGAPRGPEAGAGAWLRAANRARPGGVHRGVVPQRPGAPDRRVVPGGLRRVDLPRQPALDGHCRDLDPTSIIATFALIWYMGFTLNMLTMLALTLAVGIVIDDAIVVLENIYRFIEEKGMPPMQAAIEGTREIGLAVLATTMSLIAIFAPVGFMSGMVGRFLKSFGLTMAFAVAVSLLVSFTLTPMMCARWLKVKPREEDESHHVHDSKHSKIFGPIDRVYTRMLEWSMAHRWVIATLAVLVLFSSVPIFRVVNVNFTPQDDQSEFDVSLRAPEGTSLEATEVLANRVATAIRELPEVVYTMVTVAGDSAGTLNTASIYVRLKPIDDRERDQFVLMDEVRNNILPKVSPEGVRTGLQAPGIAGGGGGGGGQGQGDVQFVMQGPSLAELERASNTLAERAKSIPGLVDVDTSLRVGKPEISVRLDRPKAADLGVQISDAAEALRLLVGGDQVTTYNEAGEQYEVHLRAESRNRDTEAAIGQLTVPSTRLGSVPLDNIAAFTHGAAPSDIRRLNRQRQVTLSANMLPGTSQAGAQEQVLAAAGELGLGPEYQLAFAGRSRELNRTASAFLQALALSLIFMYLVLAAQFESWLHPVTILLSLPLTLPFALISILIFGQSLNIFSALGMLVLFGVVKKNSILQIDHANQLRETGLDAHQAIVQASRDRLRPILMTTLAFVAGMVPLVVTQGVGSATNHAIGFVVIGGQTLVLALTLVVTPVTYSLFEDAREKRFVGQSFTWIRSKLPLPSPVTPV